MNINGEQYSILVAYEDNDCLSVAKSYAIRLLQQGIIGNNLNSWKYCSNKFLAKSLERHIWPNIFTKIIVK